MKIILCKFVLPPTLCAHFSWCEFVCLFVVSAPRDETTILLPKWSPIWPGFARSTYVLYIFLSLSWKKLIFKFRKRKPPPPLPAPPLPLSQRAQTLWNHLWALGYVGVHYLFAYYFPYLIHLIKIQSPNKHRWVFDRFNQSSNRNFWSSAFSAQGTTMEQLWMGLENSKSLF
jgi:hypothetical protein